MEDGTDDLRNRPGAGTLAGQPRWPASHDDPRASVVQIHLPTGGGGSGLLVGPDLVLTCRHVADALTPRPGADPARHLAQLKVVQIRVGLNADLSRCLAERGLFLGDYEHAAAAGRFPDDATPWLLKGSKATEDLPHSAEGALDYGFLRLAENGRGANDPYVPLSTHWKSRETRYLGGRLLMYHFPKANELHPDIGPQLDEGKVKDYSAFSARVAGSGTRWVDVNSHRFRHDVPTAGGSSGGVLFLCLPGERQPIPFALHTTGDGTDRYASSLADIGAFLANAEPALHARLITKPGDMQFSESLGILAGKFASESIAWVDRDGIAETLCSERFAARCFVHPFFVRPWDCFDRLIDRLADFDLPASDPAQNWTPPHEQQRIQLESWLGQGDVSLRQTVWQIKRLPEIRVPDSAAFGLLDHVITLENSRRRGAVLLVVFHHVGEGEIGDHVQLFREIAGELADPIHHTAHQKPCHTLYVVLDQSGGGKLSGNRWYEAFRSAAKDIAGVAGLQVLPAIDPEETETWQKLVTGAFGLARDTVGRCADTVFAEQSQNMAAVERGFMPHLQGWAADALRRRGTFGPKDHKNGGGHD